MMKTASVIFVALLATTTMSIAASYSTSFEYADLAAMQADGWVFSQYTPNIETTIVHTGQQAIRLMPRVCVERPVDPVGREFGTLNLWVYDEGLITTTNQAGYRFGLAKGEEVIAGQVYHRTWMSSAVAYGANPAFPAATRLLAWYSSTWVDAGDLSGFAEEPPVDSRSRGVVGWANWDIIYNPDGTIEINLLTDPNGGGPKGHSSHTIGEGQAPDVGSVEFNDPGTGGADNIYLFGSWDTALPLPFGDLIVDDVTWTPAAAGCQADFDGDGDVDLDDFVILKSNFGTGTTKAQGDADGDGDVDLDDFVILKNEFGTC